VNARTNKAIDYFRFTICPDRVFRVARGNKSDEIATFCFGDDRWALLDILKPHEPECAGRVGFTGVATWLRDDAKKYIAFLWLRTKPDIHLIHATLVALRRLGRTFPDFKGRPIDLRVRHARELSRQLSKNNHSASYYQQLGMYLNRFIAFVRQQHPDVKGNDFIINFPISKTAKTEYRPLEKAQDAKIDAQRLTMIIDACTSDVKAYLEGKQDYIDPSENIAAYRARIDRERNMRKRKGLPPVKRQTPLPHLFSRAIKAQAVILAVCVGRRPTAICNTPFNVKTERVKWINETGQQEEGVRVRFRERKVRNVDEDVYCPDAFGELALQAIRTAKELTEELRRLNPAWEDVLFIVPTKNIKIARVLRPQQINEYINGVRDQSDGIIQRYNIPGGKITGLNFRHTRATNAWLGGMQVHEVAYDLGHASAEMTVRHYIVGNEESRRRLQFLMDHGALSDALEDLVGGREIIQTRLSKRHVEIMKRQGRVLTPTRYGYCALPATSGPCPTANPCYVGPGGSGEGCEHHVLSPDAILNLREDREVLELNIETYGDDPQFKAWVKNQRNQLAIIDGKLARAEDLRARIADCENQQAICECGDKTRERTHNVGSEEKAQA